MIYKLNRVFRDSEGSFSAQGGTGRVSSDWKGILMFPAFNRDEHFMLCQFLKQCRPSETLCALECDMKCMHIFIICVPSQLSMADYSATAHSNKCNCCINHILSSMLVLLANSDFNGQLGSLMWKWDGKATTGKKVISGFSSVFFFCCWEHFLASSKLLVLEVLCFIGCISPVRPILSLSYASSLKCHIMRWGECL